MVFSQQKKFIAYPHSKIKAREKKEGVLPAQKGGTPESRM